MKYSIVILPRAEHDFQALYDYIKKRSPRGANAWANAFYKALKTLEHDPLRFPAAPESAESDREVFQLIFKTRSGNPHRTLFTVLDDTVYIRTTRGYGQDYANLDDLDLPETS